MDLREYSDMKPQYDTITFLQSIALMCLVLLLGMRNSASQETVYTTGPQKAQDASHDYFFSLLKQVLPEDEFTVEVRQHFGQGRAIRSMATAGTYDIIWTGRNDERDEAMHVVPIPLFLGGLGVRGSIIRQDAHQEFIQISDLNELKPLVACQGMHWPDADILESAGLTVARIMQFDAMLQLLEKQRCDFLPLSIFEGQAEMDIVQDQFPTLMYQESVLLTYPLTMNYYVRKDFPQLAQAIEKGLSDMVESGDYLAYMQSHPLTRNAFPLERFDDAKVIVIEENKDETLKKWGLAPFFQRQK